MNNFERGLLVAYIAKDIKTKYSTGESEALGRAIEIIKNENLVKDYRLWLDTPHEDNTLDLFDVYKKYI